MASGILRKALSIVLCVTAVATPVLGQATGYPSYGGEYSQGGAAEGAMAGQTDGKANTTGILWMGGGCLLGLLGVLVAYLVTPAPPATRLLGKSPEYVAAYTEAYGAAGRSAQTNNAWIGCVAGTLIYVVAYALAAASSY